MLKLEKTFLMEIESLTNLSFSIPNIAFFFKKIIKKEAIKRKSKTKKLNFILSKKRKKNPSKIEIFKNFKRNKLLFIKEKTMKFKIVKIK
jgi:hypothetical protein